jgi:hypothetical protein
MQDDFMKKKDLGFGITMEHMISMDTTVMKHQQGILNALSESRINVLVELEQERLKMKKMNEAKSMAFVSRDLIREKASTAAGKIIARQTAIYESFIEEMGKIAFLALPFDDLFIEANANEIMDKIISEMKSLIPDYVQMENFVNDNDSGEYAELLDIVESAVLAGDDLLNSNAMFTIFMPSAIKESVSAIIHDYVKTQKSEHNHIEESATLNKNELKRRKFLEEQTKNPLLKLFESKAKVNLSENTNEMNSKSLLAESIVELVVATTILL